MMTLTYANKHGHTQNGHTHNMRIHAECSPAETRARQLAHTQQLADIHIGPRRIIYRHTYRWMYTLAQSPAILYVHVQIHINHVRCI